jgi:putative ABC transport system permease protein
VFAIRRTLRAAVPAALLGPAALAPAAARAQIDTLPPAGAPLRTVAVDERLRDDAGLRLGDTLSLAARPGAPGVRVVVGAFTRRNADPSEVARGEYRVRLHLDQLQEVADYGERVDRFAVAARPGRVDAAVRAVNAQAFGFRAYRSRDVAVKSSRTFEVVRRFHRAIGVITVAAGAAFLLCILLLKVDERRRDVAALKLVGVSRRTLVGALVAEAAAVALLGSLAGLAVGHVAARVVNWYYQGVYRTPLTFVLVTPGVVAFAVGLSLVLGAGAGWLAARRLAATPPLALFGR